MICPSVRRKSRRVDWWESRPVTKFSVSGSSLSSFFGAIIGPLTKQFPPGWEGKRENGGRLLRDRDVNPMSLGTSLAGEDYARQILRGNTCTKLGVRNSVLYTGRRPEYRGTLICDMMRNSSGFPLYVFASAARLSTLSHLYRERLEFIKQNIPREFLFCIFCFQFVLERPTTRFNHCTLYILS